MASTSENAAITRAANPYLDLPPELHRIINLYISKPSDLKALCLACEEMRVMAVELLYREFDISLDRYTVEDIERLFGEHNIGVKYIRVLRCKSHWDPHERFCSLLGMLAPDQLEGLEFYHFPHDTGHDIFNLLSTQQRNLAFISLVLGRNTTPQVWSDFPWKTCLHKLKLTVWCEELPETIIKMIQSCTNLEEIECHGLEWLAKAGKDTDRSLGSTILPGPTSLVLHNKPSYGMSWSSTIVDFSLLVKLRLLNMRSLDNFLRNLGALYRKNPPALQHLTIEAYNTDVDEVQRFLTSFIGLHTLYIDMFFRNDPMDALLQGVLHHTRSLRQLYIGPFGWTNGEQGQDVWPMSPVRLNILCRNAPNLQQLGLALPDISMEQAHSGTWGFFGEAMRALAMLPKIALLQIVSWPLPPREAFLQESVYDEDGDPHPRTLILSLLNRFATQFIQELGRSSEFPCPVISFGSRLRDYANERTDMDDHDCGVYFEPTAFFPRHRKNLYGREERYAVAVDGSELRYIEPECEVATFVLGPWHI